MKTYDPKCYELALAFLEDEPQFTHLAGDLAAEIQKAIENWIDHEVDKMHREPPPFRDLREEIERDTRAAIEASRLWGDMLNKAFGGKK
jgi:hypothetical protein